MIVVVGLQGGDIQVEEEEIRLQRRWSLVGGRLYNRHFTVIGSSLLPRDCSLHYFNYPLSRFGSEGGRSSSSRY